MSDRGLFLSKSAEGLISLDLALGSHDTTLSR